MAEQRRILIVEDDEGLRYAMTTALSRAGFATDGVSDGDEALDRISRGSAGYCAVLLDMIIPTVHGSSVLAHVARVAPQLPVIAVTGYPDRVLFADPADRRVVKAIFIKPVDPRDIAAYLTSHCDRGTEAASARASAPRA